MSEIWLVSDTHFNHKNICEYEPIARPFKSLDEMNETLIDNWNKVVSKYDKVYHLGDFCFGKSSILIAGRLKGQKRLIMGNHDCHPPEEYLKYFLSLHGALYLQKCLLTHVPVSRDVFEVDSKRMLLNAHGHYHSKIVRHPTNGDPDPLYFNCSVERHNLTPVNFDEVLKCLM